MIVTMMSLTVIQPKCRKCDKTVYLVDQLRADGIVYHKACFRCNHCNGTLKVIHCAWFGAFLERWYVCVAHHIVFRGDLVVTIRERCLL